MPNPLFHRRSKSFWFISAVALALVIVGLRLGFWQLDRAAQKQAIVSGMALKAGLNPLDNLGLIALAPEPLKELHRTVVLRGRWLPKHTVYLDNRQMNGLVGYYVITPLQLVDRDGQPTNHVVVVQRGWAPRDFLDRTNLPAIDTPLDNVVVEGRLAPPPSQLYSWASTEEGALRQNLEWARYGNEVGLPLVPYSVMALGDPSEGLKRDWPQVDAKIHTHYGYAAQWFALTLLIAGLYIWFQWIAPYRVKK
jgi:surfeit locus 1 family protein